MTSLLLAVLVALPARAEERILTGADAAPEKAVLGGADASSELSDPDMLMTMAKVESSNLENALAKGRAEAEKAASNIPMLAASLDSQLRELDTETETFFTPDLAPFMAALDAFRLSAGAAGIALAAAEPEKLLVQRPGYRAKDRLRDLHMSEDWLKTAARKAPKVGLEPADKKAAAAAAALAAAAQRLASATVRLAAKHAQRRAAVTIDVEALKTEAVLFSLSLNLAAHDQAAFDSLSGEDED
ncbi:MAG: hypothetical protein HYZ75_15260 [Elusimicrobia bacterium]|nr:hypothetical protein [Elusimicrobiota bacterium]